MWCFCPFYFFQDLDIYIPRFRIFLKLICRPVSGIEILKNEIFKRIPVTYLSVSHTHSHYMYWSVYKGYYLKG